MPLSDKLAWIIERNLHEPLTLESLAAACGVSPFHLSHAFGEAAGQSVMHYVRGRRLTKAAKALAGGGRSITDVALDAGYSSHEAFTRAFRARFGITPEAVKASALIPQIDLVEPFRSAALHPAPAEVWMEQRGAILFVGLVARYDFENANGIAQQWAAFMERYHEVEQKADPVPWGVGMGNSADGNFDYACSVMVSEVRNIPKGLTVIRAVPQTYAVFLHRGHVSALRATYAGVWNDWLPGNNHTAAEGPTLERHCESFDPATGMGDIEIWVPVVQRGREHRVQTS